MATKQSCIAVVVHVHSGMNEGGGGGGGGGWWAGTGGLHGGRLMEGVLGSCLWN